MCVIGTGHLHCGCGKLLAMLPCCLASSTLPKWPLSVDQDPTLHRYFSAVYKAKLLGYLFHEDKMILDCHKTQTIFLMTSIPLPGTQPNQINVEGFRLYWELKGGGCEKFVFDFITPRCCYSGVEHIIKILEFYFDNWLQNRG